MKKVIMALAISSFLLSCGGSEGEKKETAKITR